MVTAKETRERDRSRRDTIAKYFFDLSKLVFTGMVVGGMISFFQAGEFTSGMTWCVVYGIICTILLALVGNHVLK